ncbi:TetR/AcrR family transcriptional regulator [Arthrobacter sp.]|uniref:TetR/AcrR family transcriptional regulator n=1 Tax=Arthrobacter sp. TaxID=1667 RepID=UPI003A948A28
MMSVRHNAYLDAARASLLDVGWKRTTLTDVARRAGVSRMTIYRTWPDMESLLGDLMTREWQAIMSTLPTGHDGDAPTAADVANGALAAVAALRANPLFGRVLDVDPELLLPYLLDRRGRSQDSILAFLAEQISGGQQAGNIRPGDSVLLARTVVLAAHGLAISAQTMTDPAGIDEEALAASFAALLTRGLSA